MHHAGPENHAAPALIVHGGRDAGLACASAQRLGRPLTLLSDPGAAGTLGALWWAALVRSARESHPGLPVDDLLDCGAAPGRVHEALRCGLTRLILAPCPAYTPLAALVASLGGVLLAKPPPALDLADRHAVGRLEAWLSRRSTGPADRDSGSPVR